MDDMISRRAAIEELRRMMIALYGYDATSVISCAIYKLQNLPSAQPEVVRCKDCKYHDGLDGQCPVQSTGDPFYDYKPDDNWFCADGERRE